MKRQNRKPALLKIGLIVFEYEKFCNHAEGNTYISFGDRQKKYMPQNHFRYCPDMEQWLKDRNIKHAIEYDE